MTEIIKTQGIVLAIYPWSRTSHIVHWLTPDHGLVMTSVKGAVRPKSAFLGQYDLFYTCELLYYSRSAGALHALREVAPLNLREALRGRWRETALAGYAAVLLEQVLTSSTEMQSAWDFLNQFLDQLTEDAFSPPLLARLVHMEMEVLRLAGLAPNFAAFNRRLAWNAFSIDRGCCGEGARTVRLSLQTLHALERPDARTTSPQALQEAIRFLGFFLSFHIEMPPDIRRNIVKLLSA